MNNDIPPPNTVLRLERIMEKLAACRAAKGDNNQPGPDNYPSELMKSGPLITRTGFPDRKSRVQGFLGEQMRWFGKMAVFPNRGGRDLW